MEGGGKLNERVGRWLLELQQWHSLMLATQIDGSYLKSAFFAVTVIGACAAFGSGLSPPPQGALRTSGIVPRWFYLRRRKYLYFSVMFCSIFLEAIKS